MHQKIKKGDVFVILALIIDRQFVNTNNLTSCKLLALSFLCKAKLKKFFYIGTNEEVICIFATVLHLKLCCR